jgi:putative transposase
MLKVGQKRSKEKSALAAEPYRAHDYSRQNPVVPKSLKEFQGRTTTRNGWPKLKGKSAIAMARLCGKERNFTGEHFWARGYAVSTVGFELEQVRKYIREQESADSNSGSF